MKITLPILALLLIGTPVATVHAQDLAGEVAELRQLFDEMQTDYEGRIADLEQRLTRAERQARGAKRDADEAVELAEQTAIDLSSGSSSISDFNPGIGGVLIGKYADIGMGWEQIPGFIPVGEIGPGNSGFAIGESDFNMASNVDPYFYGNLTLSLGSDNGETSIDLEEVSLQTTALPHGFTLMGGRFFSAAGYLNKFHEHADDFIDRPLPYQAFFGGQYIVDGIQARVVLPTALLLEVGTELNWGGGAVTTANQETSPGALTYFAKVGGDLGSNNSWQFGLSWITADVVDRGAGGVPGETFSGDSDLTTVDFVWKWAPRGNPTIRNLKLQGEYFHRSEDGLFNGQNYDSSQEGWYLQGAWQFMQRWRVGYRYDVVDASNGPLFAGTVLEDPGRNSSRDTLMLDWSLSEFSRLQLNVIRDQVLSDTDNQLFLQYIMSVGAHGAHEF